MFSGFLPIPDLERPSAVGRTVVWNGSRYVSGALTGAALGGFTNQRISVGQADGSEASAVGLTWDGTSLTTTTTASNGVVITRTSAYATNGGASMAIKADDGTTAMGSGHRLGSFSFQGRRDASTIGTATLIGGYATEAWTTTAMGSSLTFETTPNLSTTRVVALTIDQDQSATFAASATVATGLSVGASAQAPVSGVISLSRSSGANIHFQTAGVSQGQVRVTGTNTLSITDGSASAFLSVDTTATTGTVTVSSNAARLAVNSTTASTTTGTGALVVAGGAGIAGAINGGSTATLAGLLRVNIATTTTAFNEQAALLATTATSTGNTDQRPSPYVAMRASIWNGASASAKSVNQQVLGVSGTNSAYYLSYSSSDVSDILNLRGDSGRVLIGTATDDGVNKLQVAGGAKVSGKFVALSSAAHELRCADAGTTSTPSAFQFFHTSSGVPAAGFGVGIDFVSHSNTNAEQLQGNVTASWVDATNASRKARLQFYALDTGYRECLRLEASGSAPMLGLYGGTAVVQYATTGTSTGFTAGAGTTATSLSTFTGNTGATAYTMGDVVRALKLVGIMAS